MQIDQHAKTILRTPLPAQFQIVESVFLPGTVFFLKQDIIHRNPDMIKPEGRDIPDIRLGDEPVKVLFLVCIKLRDPSSEIDTLLESFKLSHTGSPRQDSLIWSK